MCTRARYRFLAPLENLVYRSAGVRPEEEMDWKRYLWGVLCSTSSASAAVYALQRWQHLLPSIHRVSAPSSRRLVVSTPP